MATVPFRVSGDGRRPSRYENRNPMSNIQCRNGPHCRKFQEGRLPLSQSTYRSHSLPLGSCHYNHDFASMASNGLSNSFVNSYQPLAQDVLLSSNNSLKRSLNVESPAFTPKMATAQPVKFGISPKAAASATFTPRGSGEVDKAST